MMKSTREAAKRFEIPSRLPTILESSSGAKFCIPYRSHTCICPAKGKLTVGCQMFRIRCRQQEP